MLPRLYQNVNMNVDCNQGNKKFSLCCIPLLPPGSWLLICWGESLYDARNVSGSCPRPDQGQQQKEYCSSHRLFYQLQQILTLTHVGIIPSSLPQVRFWFWKFGIRFGSLYIKTNHLLQEPHRRLYWGEGGPNLVGKCWLVWESCWGSIPRESFSEPKLPSERNEGHGRHIKTVLLFFFNFQFAYYWFAHPDIW